jgi:hypothetical protein
MAETHEKPAAAGLPTALHFRRRTKRGSYGWFRCLHWRYWVHFAEKSVDWTEPRKRRKNRSSRRYDDRFLRQTQALQGFSYPASKVLSNLEFLPKQAV